MEVDNFYAAYEVGVDPNESFELLGYGLFYQVDL